MPLPRRVRIEDGIDPEREKWFALPTEEKLPHLVRTLRRLEANLDEVAALHRKLLANKPPPD